MIIIANRIKKTDASKLQDEYAKLVEGLQEAANDEDAFMSNPGASCDAGVASYHNVVNTFHSPSGGFAEGGNSRQYSEGRTFCRIFETLRGISEGEERRALR